MEPTYRTRLVSFLLPVVDGELYLGQRNTEPHKGMWGAIGGKNETAATTAPFARPHYIHLAGTKFGSVEDKITSIADREPLSETAVREFCEEVFSQSNYHDDIGQTDITDIAQLGFIADVLSSQPNVVNFCYFHIANIHKKDFALSPRELADLRPLSDIEPTQVYLLTRMALQQVRHVAQVGPGFLPVTPEAYGNAFFQVPEQQFDEFRGTNMPGVFLSYSRRGIKMPEDGPHTMSLEGALLGNASPAEVFANMRRMVREKLVSSKSIK